MLPSLIKSLTLTCFSLDAHPTQLRDLYHWLLYGWRDYTWLWLHLYPGGVGRYDDPIVWWSPAMSGEHSSFNEIICELMNQFQIHVHVIKKIAWNSIKTIEKIYSNIYATLFLFVYIVNMIIKCHDSLTFVFCLCVVIVA